METLFIGKNHFFLSDVDSTNTYAINLLRNVNAIEGSVIYTHNQTQGRGQRGAQWQAQIGKNITASVILKPSFLSINNTFLLSKLSALAIYDVLTELLPTSQYDIKIKWPNDILVNKKKIAGILIENQFNGNYLTSCVIGIGLNLNQAEFGDLKETATSLAIELKQEFEIETVLNALCSKLEKWYLKLKANHIQEIDSTYLEKLYGLNQSLDYENENNNGFTGIITGIAPDGKLILQIANQEKQFDLKQIKLKL